MRAKDSYHLAEGKAELFLREKKINTLPIDPFEIAKSLEIEVKPKPSSLHGVSGMLLRHGDNFGILYATHVPSEGFQRFSVAHELGHYLLEGHIDHVLPPGQDIHESRGGFVSQDPYELEADYFAAGLLMPYPLFPEAMGKFGDGITGIEGLSTLCKTSLTATAIRYVQFAKFPVAVVMSTGTMVDYCFMSETLKDFGNLDWLQKGTPLPRYSETWKFNQKSQNVLNALRKEVTANLQDWFDGRRSIEMVEEIIGLGSYGKTLTVLTILEPMDYEEEEDDDEEALERSWTPRFHR